jgi:hypothetical protein
MRPFSPERLEYLRSIGKQDEPSPTRDPIIERLRAELAQLELEASEPAPEPLIAWEGL